MTQSVRQYGKIVHRIKVLKKTRYVNFSLKEREWKRERLGKKDENNVLRQWEMEG